MLAMKYRGPSRVKAVQEARAADRAPERRHRARHALCICGSDLHLYHGLVPDTRVGCTFGHEFTGVVEEVGPSRANLKPGDRVLVPFNIVCGTCFFCQSGLYATATTRTRQRRSAAGVFGYSHTTGGYDGGQAEYVRVPFADVGPMKIPDDMDDEDVLFLTRHLPDRLPGRRDGRHPGGRHGGRVRLRAGRPLRREVGVADGRGPRHRRRPRRLPPRVRASASRNARPQLRARSTTSSMHFKKMTDGRGADVCIDAVGCEAGGIARADS